MHKPFLLKVVGIFSLIILMTWAISYINGIILERQQRNEQVKYDIAKSSAGEQTVIGPILVVPYIEEYVANSVENGVNKAELKRDTHFVHMMPEQLNLEGGFTNEYKKLGIYKALMYQLGGQVKGKFKLPANLGVTPKHPNGKLTFQAAYVSLGISDPRGISQKPAFTFNHQAYQFEQGSQTKGLGNGIHAQVENLNQPYAQTIPFELTFNLRGMEKFHFIPVAEDNNIHLTSSWQHPHFNGSFLPVHKTDKNGFDAKWSVSSLASNNQALLSNGLENNSNLALESLTIGFVEPINVYSQADRATKYGLLFIGLTFVGFYLFELLKQLRIHPAQYTLVGLSMALFYLLLISFAEHIGFASAYILASAACVILLGYYLSYVLHSKLNGFIFASLLTALYGALFGILASEDNALLMGAILVFGLLSVTMIVTRKIDWYQISQKNTAFEPQPYDVV